MNKLPIKFEKLKELKIEINVEDPREFAFSLGLFQSAPLLEHVRIKVNKKEHQWYRCGI
jgi:hypothetical protein